MLHGISQLFQSSELWKSWRSPLFLTFVPEYREAGLAGLHLELKLIATHACRQARKLSAVLLPVPKYLRPMFKTCFHV